MMNENKLAIVEQKEIEFYWDAIATVLSENGIDYALIWPICDLLGVAWIGAERETEQVSEHEACMYLIQANECDGTFHHKIGYTSQQLAKYTNLLVDRSPSPLRLEHVIRASEYRRQCTHREWFQITPVQVAEVTGL